MYQSKQCRVCGCTFIPSSSRQLDCNKEIVRTCVICGSTFTAKCSQNDSRITCSTRCGKLHAQQNMQKSIQATTRKCVLCGEEFTPVSATQKYCKVMHPAVCEVCGSDYLVDTSKQELRRTCSDTCAVKLRFQNGNPLNDPGKRSQALDHYLERTGYNHPMKNPEVLEKLKQTNINKYGVSRFTQTPQYIEKATETNRERYGTSWPMQNDEVKKKRVATLLDRYGVDSAMKIEGVLEARECAYLKKTGYLYPAQNPEVIEKTRSTNLERYGNEYAVASEAVKEKSVFTIKERFGVDHPLQCPEILDKVKATNLERYGNTAYVGSDACRQALHKVMSERHSTQWFSQTAAFRAAMMQDSSKAAAWMQFLEDANTYLDEHYTENPTLHELSSALGVTDTTISYWVRKLNVTHRVRRSLSNGENELVEILHEIDPNLEIQRNVRYVISGRELDIYIPKLKLAIEFNPTVTHNSSVSDPWGGPPKPYNYHLLKSLQCEEKDIFLFHIFGYEWAHSNRIITSMLRNLLNSPIRRIYARKCEVREINSRTCCEFLNYNHRQHATVAPIRLGLYFQDELVSVMTFGKMRQTSGTGNEDLSDCYELSRFCSLLNTSVVGGASKLFSHFCKHYRPTRVRSFSDRAHAKGTLYATLGFTKIRESDPGYVWVDSRTDISYHRQNAQKHNLKTFLHDDSIDLAKTEKQIMEEHSFLQVFDCGTVLWEWTCDSKKC